MKGVKCPRVRHICRAVKTQRICPRPQRKQLSAKSEVECEAEMRKWVTSEIIEVIRRCSR